MVIVATWGGSLIAAPGIREYRTGQSWRVPYFAKKVVVLPKVVVDSKGRPCDGFATISWEEGDRGEVLEPPAKPGDPYGPKRGVYGHTALIAVYLPDVKELDHPMHNRGEIAFLPPQLIEFTGGASETNSDRYENDLAVDDINADGRPDLLILNAYGQEVGVFLNKGSGKFGSTPDIKLKTNWPSLTKIPGADEDLVIRPYQFTVGNFSEHKDGLRDIAIQYIDEDRMLVAIFIATRQGDGSIVYNTQGKTLFASSETWLPMLKFNLDCPFYSITHGDWFNMRTIPLSSGVPPFAPRDALAFTFSSFFDGVMLWDTFNSEIGTSIVTTVYAPGAFTVTNMGFGNPFDILYLGGHSIATGSVAPFDAFSKFPTTFFGYNEGVVAADFDLDGNMDVAQVRGGDVIAKTAGTKLIIGYGNGALGSPLIPFGMPDGSGVKIDKHHTVIDRWWENPLSMTLGNFTGNYAFDPITGSADLTRSYPDIITLGADWVTIHTNVGEFPDQLNTPHLEQILTGPEAGEADTVKVSGTFHLGTPSEIKNLVLKADPTIGGKSTMIPRASLTITTGMPETLEFTVPSGLAIGDYSLVVNNSGKQSNELKLTIIAKPKLDALLTGPEAKLNDTVVISGNFLLGTLSEITELVLTPSMGMATSIPKASLMITAGMPDILEFTVPGSLALDDYIVTVKNMKYTSNGLKLKLVP